MIQYKMEIPNPKKIEIYIILLVLLFVLGVKISFASEESSAFSIPIDIWSEIESTCTSTDNRYVCKFFTIETEFLLKYELKTDTNWGKSLGTRIGIVGASGGLLLPLLFTNIFDSQDIVSAKTMIESMTRKRKKVLTDVSVSLFFDGIKQKEMQANLRGEVTFTAPIDTVIGMEVYDLTHGLFLKKEFYNFEGK